MAGRSAKYRREDSPYRGGIFLPPPPPSVEGPPPPYGSVYNGPGFAPVPSVDMRRPPTITSPLPPQIMQGGNIGSGVKAMPHSPWAGLNKHQSEKVTQPLPSVIKFSGKEAPLYEDLINFPRAKDKDEMRCVMCGLPPGECVIPRQNKDVCKDCDKATWLHTGSQVYFKWCKGCKKFLKLASFSQKVDAAKCDKCRERGRHSYLQKKAGKEGDDVSHQSGGRHQHHHHHHHVPPTPPHPHHLPPPPPHIAQFPHHHYPPLPPPHAMRMAGPHHPVHHLPLPPHAIPPMPFVEGGVEVGDMRHPRFLGPPLVHQEDDEDDDNDDEDEEMENEEDAIAADAALSKMKLSTNFGAPLGRLQEGGGGVGSPGREGSSGDDSSGAAPSTVPPTIGTGEAANGEEPTAPSSTAAPAGLVGPNNLVELARIHQKVVDLEAQAEQLKVITNNLKQEQARNRNLNQTVQELSMEVDLLRHENATLKMELEHLRNGDIPPVSPPPCPDAGGPPSASDSAVEKEEEEEDTEEGKEMKEESTLKEDEEEGEAQEGAGDGETTNEKKPEVFELKEIKQEADKKDKRGRSDSITGAAALLGGFKKQRVGGGSGLHINAQGATEEAAVAASPQGKTKASIVHNGIFGEGYETPRGGAIKGSAIAL